MLKIHLTTEDGELLETWKVQYEEDTAMVENTDGGFNLAKMFGRSALIEEIVYEAKTRSKGATS